MSLHKMTLNNFSIPVLMYHHVNPDGNFINARPDLFESHLRVLKASGYEAIDCRQLECIFKGELSISKPVMITFDDGWLDNWVYAFPLLKKYSMKAVIFAVTSYLSEKGLRPRTDQGGANPLPVHRGCMKMIENSRGDEVMLSWEELKEMENSGLIDIQSHSHTHQRWDRMIKDDHKRKEAVREELRLSKYLIEHRLGKTCNSVCWPWGIYDDAYIEEAADAGYELMFTTEKGTNTLSSNPRRIKRLVIGNISTFSFRKKLFIHSREWLSRLYLKYF